MAAIVVIPARLASTRFPEKIIVARTGRPLVQHVVDQVRRCRRVTRIVVAADDRKIEIALKPYGTEVILTDPAHPSGTDRIAEVARGRREAGPADEIIVNVQGDEPEIEPEVVDGLIDLLERSGPDTPMATAAVPFPSAADPADPNLVKMVLSVTGHAVYFSRAAIPFDRDGNQRPRVPFLLHVGIYAYRRDFLLQYASWAPTPLELTEKLEQLRVLEHGKRIAVLRVERTGHGIDTPAQYEQFVQRQQRRGSP